MVHRKKYKRCLPVFPIAFFCFVKTRSNLPAADLYGTTAKISQAEADQTAAATRSNDDSALLFFPSRDLKLCSGNNFVLDRNNPLSIHLQVPSNLTAQPYSLQSQDFQWNQHHNIDHTRNQNAKTCDSVQDFLTAIKYGQRKWQKQEQQNMSLLEKERHPSVFVPYGCNVPILSPPQLLCGDTSVLSQFSTIALVGDSLARHAFSGLISLLKNNLAAGWVEDARNVEMEQKCVCDGQFSEHATCRRHNPRMYTWDAQKVHSMTATHHDHLCNCKDYNTSSSSSSSSSPNLIFAEFWGPIIPQQLSESAFLGTNCSSGRPMLLILEGGFHFKTNATRTYEEFQFIFSNPAVQRCAQSQGLLVIWCSLTTVSPYVNKKYSNQSPENAMKFNTEMQKLFLSSGSSGDGAESSSSPRHVNVTVIDWMNMTKAAQTVDGVHQTTNVNYFKAQHLLLVGDAMLREGRFYARSSSSTAIRLFS